jgi:(1->4)-alpha-D-glucan 1-alpha-D-glucosylmutase
MAPDAWITVEKILEADEELPKSWPVAGTTGYDAMREVNGVFVDADREAELTALYTRLTGDERSIAEHVEQGKRMVVESLLPAEVRRMAALAPEVPVPARPCRDRRRLPRVPLLPARRGRAAGRGHRHRPDPPAGAGRHPGRLDDRLHDPADELARRMQQLSGATMAKGSRTRRTTATPGSSP